MSEALPKDIRDQVKAKIWSRADELSWDRLPDSERTVWYGNWAKDKEIGGVLSHFMDPRRVRVYIKDSLLKPYIAQRMEAQLATVMSHLCLPPKTKFRQHYEKPHGRVTLDGRVICWGSARDWKTLLMAAFERAYSLNASTVHGVALFESGRPVDDGTRALVAEVAKRLNVLHIAWL